MKNEQLYTNPFAVINAYMEAWSYQHYSQMYKLVNKAWASTHELDYLWNLYSDMIIDDYEIITQPSLPEQAMVQIQIRIKFNGQWMQPALVNLVCETEAYKPSLHGNWGVNPTSTLKLIQRLKTRAERRNEEHK